MPRRRFTEFTELKLVLLGFSEFYWVLLGFYWFLPSLAAFYWVLPSFTGFYWVFTYFYLVWPGFTEFNRVLQDFTEFYRVLLGFTLFFGLRRATAPFRPGLDDVLPSLPSFEVFSRGEGGGDRRATASSSWTSSAAPPSTNRSAVRQHLQHFSTSSRVETTWPVDHVSFLFLATLSTEQWPLFLFQPRYRQTFKCTEFYLVLFGCGRFLQSIVKVYRVLPSFWCWFQHCIAFLGCGLFLQSTVKVYLVFT